MFIDEYQRVPEVLDAIKAQLNRDSRPGRFVLTGSTSYTTLPRAAQSLTGRARVITVPPLSQLELADRGAAASGVDRMLADPAAFATGRPGSLDRSGYASRVLTGGFPIALRRPDPDRHAWFDSYLDLVIKRDVLDIKSIRQSEVLPRLLRRLVARTGQLLNTAAVARAENLDASVAGDYLRLMEAVFLVRRLPAWGTTLGSRVNKMAKLHVMDTGVGGWLLGLAEGAIDRRDPSALSELGHLLETFTVNEVLAQAGWRRDAVQAGHYRTHDGQEVDLVLQFNGNDVVAVEVKAGERVTSADTAQLARLRDKLGERFRGGVVLHTGLLAGELDDRIHAAPIERLWATSG